MHDPLVYRSPWHAAGAHQAHPLVVHLLTALVSGLSCQRAPDPCSGHLGQAGPLGGGLRLPPQGLCPGPFPRSLLQFPPDTVASASRLC